MRPTRSAILRAIYAACLLGATCNHAATLIAHGVFWDYGGVPWPSAAFWTSLTLADPVAAVLLFIRPPVGVIATAAIVTADVAHNLWITWLDADRDGFLRSVVGDRNVMEQIAFLIFVAATCGLARPATRPASSPAAAARGDLQSAPPRRHTGGNGRVGW